MLHNTKKIIDDIVCQLSYWKHKEWSKQLRESNGDYTLEGFDRLQCIYVHIPKTAGVAVNKALYGNYGGAHHTVHLYKRIFGPLTFRKYYKVTFVRNPYTRLLSAFNFLKNGGFGEADRLWADNNIAQYISFNDFVSEWLNEDTIWSFNHFKPQYSFVCDVGLQPEVDFIGKFETIDDDFCQICAFLGIPNRLKVRNKGEIDNSEWQSIYSKNSLNKVTKLYSRDFEIFDYQPYG